MQKEIKYNTSMKKMRNHLLLIGVILLLSCNGKYSDTKKETKRLAFSSFSIEVPVSWENRVFKGIDYSADYILIENKDTIHIDFGSFKEGFDDVLNVFSFKQKKKYDSLGLDTSSLVFSKIPDIDAAQGTFLSEYYLYDTIDNYKVKLRIPKKIGKGITGVYFDSINSKEERLKIYARNLDSLSQRKLLRVFKSIKIEQR